MDPHRAAFVDTYQRISAVTLVACTAVTAALWAGTTLPMGDHELFPQYIALTAGFAVAAAAVAALRHRVAGTLETPIARLLVRWLPEVLHLLVYKFWLPGVITMACYLVVPLSSPTLVDGWLAWPEEVLGVEHPVTWAVVRDAGLMPLADAVYPLVEHQTLLLFFVALARRDLFRIWQFIAVLAVCSATSIAFLYALPADGAWAYFEGRYGHPPPTPPAWLPELHALRAGRIDDVANPHGLLCFPSFHTVFAVLLIRAWRDERWLFFPMLVLNVLIVLATIPVGWHYLTDVAAGVALAAGVSWLVDAAARRRSRAG